MDRIKSAALNALGLVVALAALGFFATIGFAFVGLFAALGLIGAVAGGIAGMLASKQEPDIAKA
ncbi:hypothetical protein [uncultured Pelagimonas sp.]|uniref:hypothetical protein n=1 Tax=uncultured Pelagimonas sp. TaxID=1618102 RepID=UPI00261B2A1F|nr:hypothetical protein [uncultured Pelagimonas sp.]